MRVVILAGGKGGRLVPYTKVLPKPLMPIGDMPILEVILRQLKNHGFEKVTIAVGHLSELLITFFNDGSKFGLKINYSIEDKPLGTAGPLSLIKDLDDDFIVMNGDVLTNLNYLDFYQFHKEQRSMVTIASYERTVKVDFGVIETGKNNRITEYVEKPTLNYKVSMGIYGFNPKVMKYIKPDSYFDFPDLVKLLINEGEKVTAYPFNGYWLDIGRLDDYEKATAEFQQNKNMFLP